MKSSMPINLAAASTLILLPTLACRQHDTATSALRSQTLDSAGIQVVENPAPPAGSRLGWRIGPKPTVSIGTREGEEAYQFYIVRDAMMMPDGRIIVANGGTGELRMFDALGTHLASWGGEGEGPGEFDNLWQIEPWPGDSIAAWFAPRMGISVFDAEGNYARTFTLAAAPGRHPGSSPGRLPRRATASSSPSGPRIPSSCNSTTARAWCEARWGCTRARTRTS